MEKVHSEIYTKPKNEKDENPNSKDMMQQPVPVIQSQQYYINQPQQMTMPYGQPVMMSGALPSNPYIMNQINPIPVTPLKFGILSRESLCPFCQTNAPTKIEESFNCCTCLTYFFIIILIPILIILAAYSGGSNVRCDGGSCNCDCNCSCSRCYCKCCFDVNHYCSNCGKLLGTRDSCHELCPCCSACLC